MANPLPVRSCIVRLRSIGLSACLSALVLACSGGGVSNGPNGAQAGSSAGGAATGGASAGGATSTGGGSNAAGTSAGGGGPVTPLTYTSIGDNNASWAGCSTGDTLVANGSGYLPMATSDCPLDPDMAIVAPYKDKIFNGCLDECFGDTNMAGHGKATVIDWTIKSGGWAVAEISSTLHWTGIWPPAAGPDPITLVFWVKGAVGGEESLFTVAVHAHASNNNSKALKVPIKITQQWQRVVMPWSGFGVLASPYPDAITFSATAAGHVTIFIDQAYVSKTVPLP